MPNKKIVLDSSVFLKIFFTEHDSDKAISLLDNMASNNISIIVPDLFIHEIYSICAKDNNWTHALVSHVLEKYQSYLTIVPINKNLSAVAFQMAQTGHPKSGYPSFYDCFYHALAIQEKCTFITADEKHFTKTHKKFGHIKLLKNA